MRLIIFELTNNSVVAINPELVESLYQNTSEGAKKCTTVCFSNEDYTLLHGWNIEETVARLNEVL